MNILSILHSSKKLPPPDKTGLLLPAVREVQSVIETYTNIKCCKAIIHPPSMNSREILESIPGVRLPDALFSFYRETEQIEFSWIAAPDYVFGSDFYDGDLTLLSPADAKNLYLDVMCDIANEAIQNGWEKNDAGYAALVNDWPHWFPVLLFANGDCLCIDMTSEQNRIVYCEHDVMDGGPNLHGLQIAPDLETLIYRWKQMLFAENFDWTRAVDETGINLDSELLTPLVQAYRKFNPASGSRET